MRALALTHVFPRGEEDPSAPFLLTWARALAEAGVDIAVVAPHDAGLPLRHAVRGIPVRLARYAPDGAERLAYRGEMHHIARTPAGPGLITSLVGNLARTVRAQVRAGHPDVLHVHWWVPGAIAARLARVHVPTVLTVHGTDVALLESRPRIRPIARWALASVDRVEAVSSSLAERFEAVTGRPADAVNPMPMLPERLALRIDPPTPSDALRVLGIGRLVPEKGFGDLVEAATRCTHQVALTIVGDGPERDALAAQARRLGVTLDLPGSVSPDQLTGLYAGCDVVAQPSHSEGFGLVAAEAVVAGVPVVATDSGGPRDLLGSRDLVPVGDVAALARALDAVADDPAAARARTDLRAQTARAMLAPEAAAARTLSGYRAVSAS